MSRPPGREPTGPIKVEAASAGKVDTAFGRFDRIQVVTPADVFHGGGASFHLLPLAAINRRAARVETRASHQPGAQGTRPSAASPRSPPAAVRRRDYCCPMRRPTG